MANHADLTGTELHEPKGVAAAAADTVYKANGSGSGAWAKVASDEVTSADSGGYYTGTDVEAILQEIGPTQYTKTYSGLYVSANTTAETPTGSGTWDEWVTGWTTGLNSNMTQNTGSGYIEVIDDGIYQAIVTATVYQSGASSATWLLGLGLDSGVGINAISKATQSRTTSSSDRGVVGLNALLDLNTGDKIYFLYQRTAGSVDFILNYCNINLSRIA